MRRFSFGLSVLIATASVTLAITWCALAPDAPARLACPPAPHVERLLYIETGDGPLHTALAADFAVTSRTPATMPADLAPYDRVVVSDVPAHLLSTDQVAALDAYA